MEPTVVHLSDAVIPSKLREITSICSKKNYYSEILIGEPMLSLTKITLHPQN